MSIQIVEENIINNIVVEETVIKVYESTEVLQLEGGGSGSTYEHDQTTPSNHWIINHNLGKHPAVTVVDSSGYSAMADVQYVNSNRVDVYFNTLTAGIAYLN